MTLVDLRKLTDNANAPAFDRSGSPLDRLFAYDYNEIRKGIMTGEKGIRTRDLEVVADAEIGGELLVQDDVGIAGLLGVVGLAALAGGLTVTGDIAVSGTVDGVDLANHVHSGSDGTTKIPLASIAGVAGSPTPEWTTHNHAADGSDQIPTAGIEDGAVTFGKVASSSFGLTSTLIARGDRVQNTRLRVSALLGDGVLGTELPSQAVFISPFAMAGVGTDTEAQLVDQGPGSPALGIAARKFRAGTYDAVRFSFVVPSYVETLELMYLFWTASLLDVTLTQESYVLRLDDFVDNAAQDLRVVTLTPSEPGTPAFNTAGSTALPRLDSPPRPEFWSVRLSSDVSLASDIYLAGVCVLMDPNFEVLDT